MADSRHSGDNQMKLHSHQGVKYSSDFFDEDIIGLLLKPSAEVAKMPASVDLAARLAGVEVSEATAFTAAWDEVASDPELSEALKHASYTKEKGLSEFQSNLSKALPASMQKQLNQNLRVDYKVVSENDSLVHYVDGEVALEIPLSVDSAQKTSSNGEAALNAIFIVIDCLSIAAAIASINVHVNKSKIAKSLKNPLKRFIATLFNAKNVRELERLKKAGDNWLLIQRILSSLRGTANLRVLVTTFFSAMSRFEKAVAVVQFLASLALMIATAGGSYGAKLAQLGAAVTLLLADVAAFVISVRKS